MNRADRLTRAHARATGELATWLCRAEVDPGVECSAAGTVPAGEQARAQHAHYLEAHWDGRTSTPPASRR